MVREPGDRGDVQKNGVKDLKNNGSIPSTRPKKQYLNFGEEDQMEIYGYKINTAKKYATYTLYYLTLGLLRLVFHWYPQWRLKVTHSLCSLDVAEKVLIVDNYKGKFKSFFVKNVEILKVGEENTGTTLTKSQSIISINGLIFSKDSQDRKQSLTVYLNDGTKKRLPQARIILCKKLMYVWDEDQEKFVKLSGLDKMITNAELHRYRGYTKTEQNTKRITYGANEINVPVQSVMTLLVLEALTPFYMFQLFSIVVWLAEFYFYYTIAIAVMSVFGISTSIIQTRRNQQNLKGTVHLTDKVLVSRGDGTFDEVPTTDLVPGDLIVIPPHGCEMQCDAVLLNGNCIVNESMLTGESVPITKTPLPDNSKLYDVKEHGNHTLFCGTKVIQTRYYGEEHVVAVVIRTGYLTSKGQLVRSILYPPPADFKFDQDSYKFIMILAVIALVGCLYTIFSKYSRDIAPWDIIIKSLDVITIAIPPALPAAMTVGKLYALNRLKKSKIYCINSRVINVSGSLNCICFDKTGTLTEDGLDMWGVVPVSGHEIGDAVKNIQTISKDSPLIRGMVTSHSLTLIDEELSGDPLDVKMFESTGWVLEEPSIPDSTKYDLLVPTIVKPSREGLLDADDDLEIGIIQQYQFSSTLQRMSVVCRRLGSEYFEIFCKGSPEMIVSLSKPETVPEGIMERLREYTEQGYRVIGMGTRTIKDVPFHKIPKLHREDVECDLEFIGLIILDNRLKPETTKVIETLKKAGMKIVMITGDNIQTAVSVARECGIIQPGYSVIDVITTKPTQSEVATIQYHMSKPSPIEHDTSGKQLQNVDVEKTQDQKYHLVVTGNSWANITRYFPHLVPKIATKGVVFARMSGQQKQQLIEELQNLGYYVAMCGDGANDCGALKAAHVGISLSEAESSVASPFTSRDPNISCTAKVVQEGRAALVTSFGVFKMMLCYSITELASVLILYAIDSNLTSLQFLFIDICLILNFASLFGKTKAYPKLHNKPPMTSLLSFIPLVSIIFFMVSAAGFQVLAFYYIQTFGWFEPFVYDSNNSMYYVCYENYAVFAVSMFQYITMTVIFSKGKPYRKAMVTNYFLTFSICAMLAICAYITLDAAGWVVDALELRMPPYFDGKIAMIVIAAINFFVCFLVEDLIVDYFLRRVVKPKFHNIDKSSKKYLRIERDLKLDQTWPIAGSTEQIFTEVDEKGDRKRGVINGGFDGIQEVTRF